MPSPLLMIAENDRAILLRADADGWLMPSDGPSYALVALDLVVADHPPGAPDGVTYPRIAAPYRDEVNDMRRKRAALVARVTT